MIKKYNYIVFILFILNSFALVQTCFSINGDWRNILVGSLVSFIFYFMVVFIPTYLRKENAKRAFLHFYNQFREDVLREVLNLAEFSGDKNEEVERLKDPDNFISFAKEPSGEENQNNWHVLMNNIDTDDHRHARKTIVVRLSELQREADFLVRTVGVEDEALLQNFRRLDRSLQDGRYKEELDWNWGEDKEFTDSLYELLSGKSLVSADQGDFIKEWVRKL